MVIKSINDLKKKENARRKARESTDSRNNKMIDKHSDRNCKLFVAGDTLHIKRPKIQTPEITYIKKIRCPSCNAVTQNVNKKKGEKFVCSCGVELWLSGSVLEKYTQ